MSSLFQMIPQHGTEVFSNRMKHREDALFMEKIGMFDKLHLGLS